MPRRASFGRLAAALLLLSAPSVLALDVGRIAKVGGETVTADELSRRLATIPDFQRRALGNTPETVTRQVLETLVIPDYLYAAEAARLKLADRPSVRNRTRESLCQAVERELRRQIALDSPVTAEDVQAYFKANRARFETPRRLKIWRILTDDEALAKKIVEEAKGVAGLQRWSQFARENSLDKATQLRDGDLGFVHPDGKTDVPTLRVDPALFGAADQLVDGEIAKAPIHEGSHWAVIWRRGSMPAISRTVAQEAGSIRQVLERERLEKARQELVIGLRARYVSATNAALLDGLHFDGEGLPARETRAHTPHPAPAGSTSPVPGERGAR